MVLQIDTCMQAWQPGLMEKCKVFIEKSVFLKQKCNALSRKSVINLGDIYDDQSTIKHMKLMYIYFLQRCTYDIAWHIDSVKLQVHSTPFGGMPTL